MKHLAVLFLAISLTHADHRPNIIFILSDDLSWGDLGCYGQKQILTPNIDRLAREGMRFTNAYAGNSVCAPSRSCLMQGLHSGVNPISGDFSTGAAGLLISGGEIGQPVREFTIASTLQKMLLDIDEVGGDIDWLPMRAAGMSLVIHDVTMSGS